MDKECNNKCLHDYVESKAKINGVFLNSLLYSLSPSKKFQKLLILHFEANSATSRFSDLIERYVM